MEDDSTTTDAGGAELFAGEAWFDPIEAGLRGRVRGFIEELLEQELTAALGRGRSERAMGEPKGYRNGTRARQLLGSFGPVAIDVPRARMSDAGSGSREWRSSALPRYARRTRQVEALIAGAYLAGVNTRRVKRALGTSFGGAVGKDIVSRTSRNAIERLHEEFKRRIKTQTVLPSAETAAMLFWALLASGQITMRKVDGWQTLAEPLANPVPLDLAA